MIEGYKPREDLREKLIKAFADQEEVCQIFFFGREAEGKSDRFSDLDTIVCSSDPQRTRLAYRDIFGSISPVRATFPLARTATEFTEMVMLQDYSPYHKVDFSIVSDISQKAWAAPRLLVYENQAKQKTSQTGLSECPIRRDVAYKLNDILFSVPRFTKCLFRRDLDMYRRWKGITNVTLVVLYEKHYGWEAETPKRKLTGYEAKRLYQVLDAGEKELLDSIYPTNAKLDLASSYQASMDLFTALSRQKAEHFGIALDLEFIQYIKEFMDSEISRYQEQNNAVPFPK